MQRLHGRAVAVAQARLRLDRLRAGEGGLLLFTGEPGIGKTSVAEHVGGAAAEAGAIVVWGRCWEAGGAPAYWPWIQVFRGLGIDEDPFASAPLAAPPGADAASARFRAFDQAVRRLKQAAGQRPVALVLDDLHAADVPSLLLLLLLARELRRTPILVVGTFREAEARLNPEVAALLVKVAREGEVVPLGRLSAEACGAWIQEAWPEASAADSERLYRVTEGHPLFLVEALRLGGGAGARQRVLEGLGAVLDERLAHLAPAAHDLVQVAAVLGREFTAADVAATAGRSLDEVHRALREATAASIVLAAGQADAPAGGRFRFSHVLLRDRLYAELAPSARAALHWQAGTALLAGGQEAQAAAHHLFAGASAGQPQRLAEVALAAAMTALERLAFEDADQLAARALALAERAPLPDALTCRLALTGGEAAIRLGHGPRGKQLCVRAAELAERLGADDLLIRAALVYGTDLASGSVDPVMVALLRKALRCLDPADSPLRARVTARLAAALSPPVSEEALEEMLALAHAATAMARRLGDPHALLHVLPFVAATSGFAAPETERFALVSETVALARTLDQPLVLLHALPAYVTALLAHGRMAEAEQALRDHDELLTGFPHPHHRCRNRILHAVRTLLAGRFEQAEALSAEARALAQGAGDNPGLNLVLNLRLCMAQLRRQPEMIRGDAEVMAHAFAAWRATRPLAAWISASLGRRDEAHERLRDFDLARTNNVALFGAADACVALGEAELARAIYAPLAQAAGERPFSAMAPGTLFGPLGRTLGDVAVLIGRPAEAARHYDRAAADCRGMGADWLADECQRLRDQALAAAGSAAAGVREAPRAGAPEIRLALRREGDVWAVLPAGAAPFRLKHGKGLQYLSYLLEQPGREVHVLELVGAEHQAGDAGPVLDARAKAEYRARLDDLRDQLAEAERFSDPARARRLEAELQAIAEQLSGAVGLGGRDRVASSDVERARINVQRRLKDTIDRIAGEDPALGRYLTAAIRTGTTCVYQPV